MGAMSYAGSAALYSSSVHGHHNQKGKPFLMLILQVRSCVTARVMAGGCKGRDVSNAEGSEKYEVCVEMLDKRCFG